MVPNSWTENSKIEVQHFLANKSSISGLWVFDWISGYLDTWIPGGATLGTDSEIGTNFYG